jgi:hypothetical protein
MPDTARKEPKILWYKSWPLRWKIKRRNQDGSCGKHVQTHITYFSMSGASPEQAATSTDALVLLRGRIGQRLVFSLRFKSQSY